MKRWVRGMLLVGILSAGMLSVGVHGQEVGQVVAPPEVTEPMPLVAPPGVKEPIPRPAWAPANGLAVVDLQKLGLAKSSADQRSVRVLLPEYKTINEEAIRTVNVPKTRTGTREVSRAGQTVVEEYTITEYETVTQAYMRSIVVPAGHLQFNVPMESIKAKTLGGESVANSSLPVRLQAATHVFIQFEELLPDAITQIEIDPFYAPVLRLETVVLHVPLAVINEATFVPYEMGVMGSDAPGDVWAPPAPPVAAPVRPDR